MSETTPNDRVAALALVKEYTTDPALLRHMLSVEAAMRAYAARFGGDSDLWGIVGLLHDFDYQRWPLLDGSGHPLIGVPILREHGWSEEIIRAILSHAPELTGIHPESLLEKSLCAVDELTGLIAAVAFVRPSKNIADVQVSSVKKKWKDKAFTAAIDRQENMMFIEALGVPFDEHVQRVLTAMQGIAAELGVAG